MSDVVQRVELKRPFKIRITYLCDLCEEYNYDDRPHSENAENIAILPHGTQSCRRCYLSAYGNSFKQLDDLSTDRNKWPAWEDLPKVSDVSAQAELCQDEGCDHYGTPHICRTPKPSEELERLRNAVEKIAHGFEGTWDVKYQQAQDVSRAALAAGAGEPRWRPIEADDCLLGAQRLVYHENYGIAHAVFSKTPHAPLYGWLRIENDVENMDLLNPQPRLAYRLPAVPEPKP